ncbi:MAG: hypothetical protein V3R87_00835 [Dehalococcoidia bacterium]
MSSLWRKTVVAACIVVLTLLVVGVLPVAAQTGDGVIQGRVVNETEGGGNVTQQEVLLSVFLEEQQVDDPAPVVTDDKGSFEFAGLDTGSNYVYQLTIEFQEAGYVFEPFSFEGDTVRTANLVVFASTSSDETIRVDQAHIIVTVRPESLEVTEWYQFVNDGNTTYVGSRETGQGAMETLRFSLPEDAVGLTMDGDVTNIELVPGGFVDTTIFLPGPKVILFYYTIDVTSESYILPVTLHYPVDSLRLMVIGDDVDVICDQLLLGEPLVTEEGETIQFLGSGLERDTTLDIRLSGLEDGGGGLFSWQGIVILVAAHAAGLGALTYWRRRRKARRVAVTAGDEGIAGREKLLEELARLDDAFERGDISEEDYSRERSQMKARLVEITGRGGTQGDG